VTAMDVIAVASKLYATHNLVAPDANTLTIRNVGGGKTSYIPVPASTTGSFAVSIPVSTPAAMLGPERNILAIFKWRLSQLPSTSRWYPVLKKYIGYIEGRILGLGGNPITVVQSPYGSPPPSLGGGSGGHGGGHRGHHRHEKHTGKVEGLVYDRFGDFDGFVFRAEDGSEHRYRSRNGRIEELVLRAWRQRMVVEVHGQRGDPIDLAQVILKEWPVRES
jgi:hypothetical protein